MNEITVEELVLFTELSKHCKEYARITIKLLRESKYKKVRDAIKIDSNFTEEQKEVILELIDEHKRKYGR